MTTRYELYSAVVGYCCICVGIALVQGQSKLMQFQTDVAKPQLADPDSYGYRYCASWKTADSNPLWSDCLPFETTRCGKKLEFDYRCCTQFDKVPTTIFAANPSGKQKCARVNPQWDNCPNVISNIVGYADFADHLRFGDFVGDGSTSTFTIFAPYTENQKEITEIYGKFKNRDNTNPILHHVVKNRVYAADLRDGQTLQTVLGTQLKVTKYPNGITCVDCVEIMEADLECKNGIVHFIKTPLFSPKGMQYESKNVFELLQGNPKTKSFANDLPSDVQAALQNVNSGNWYTVLAPTEQQWMALRSKYPDSKVRAQIALSHVLPRMLCSSGILQSINGLATVGPEVLGAECGTESSPKNAQRQLEVRYVTNACGDRRKLVQQDLAASNGVVHIIEDALIPLSVRKLEDALKCGASMNFQKFAEFIKDCDLRMENGKQYAVLLPMDYAFDWWKDYKQFKEEYDKFMTDKEYRCRVARYHIAAFNKQLENITTLGHQQYGFKTNNIDTRFETNYFLKDKYQSQMYYHYSPVVNFEAKKFADGSLYRLKRINVIPEKFLVDQLKERSELSISYDKVVKAKLNEKSIKPEMPMTLFLATRNDGWKSKTGEEKPEMKYDAANTEKFLLLHSVPNYLWGGDIGYFKPNTVHKFMSKVGIELTFWVDADGTMRIGHDKMGDKMTWPKVVQFNIPAIDGIIWVLDGTLLCPTELCPEAEIDIFDVWVAACTKRELADDKRDMTTDFKRRPYDVAINYPTSCVYYNQPVKMVPELTP